MKEILLIISLICSLSFTGCSEEQKTDKQVNDLPKQKVEQKIEKEKTTKTDKPKKEEKQKTEEPKRETKKKDTESKQEETEQKDNKEEKDLAEDAAERRNFVISQCVNCGKLIHESDNYIESHYGYVCMDCYNNSYEKCIRCGKTVNAYDDNVSCGSSGYMCEDCDKEYSKETEQKGESTCPGCGMQMTEINGIYCCLNINCYRYNNPYDNDPDHYDLPSED